MKTYWNSALKNLSTIQFISLLIYYLLLDGRKMYATVYGCWLHELKMSTCFWLKKVKYSIVMKSFRSLKFRFILFFVNSNVIQT